MSRCRLLLAVLAAGALPIPARALGTGKAAPSVSLRKLGGGRLVLRELRGKTVLLSFWTAG